MSLIRNWCAPYEVIADVGAGHGRLSIALAERQHRVYATERTVSGYAELISRVMGHPGIMALKGDGLQPLAPYKVDAVVVAGMGPGPIRHILDPRHEGPFIIQPMQGILTVHRHLAEDGWHIERAQLLVQHGRLYATWVVRPGSASASVKAPDIPGEFVEDPLFSLLKVQRVRELQKRLAATGATPSRQREVWTEEIALWQAAWPQLRRN